MEYAVLNANRFSISVGTSKHAFTICPTAAAFNGPLDVPFLTVKGSSIDFAGGAGTQGNFVAMNVTQGSVLLGGFTSNQDSKIAGTLTTSALVVNGTNVLSLGTGTEGDFLTMNVTQGSVLLGGFTSNKDSRIAGTLTTSALMVNGTNVLNLSSGSGTQGNFVQLGVSQGSVFLGGFTSNTTALLYGSLKMGSGGGNTNCIDFGNSLVSVGNPSNLGLSIGTRLNLYGTANNIAIGVGTNESMWISSRGGLQISTGTRPANFVYGSANSYGQTPNIFMTEASTYNSTFNGVVLFDNASVYIKQGFLNFENQVFANPGVGGGGVRLALQGGNNPQLAIGCANSSGNGDMWFTSHREFQFYKSLGGGSYQVRIRNDVNCDTTLGGSIRTLGNVTIGTTGNVLEFASTSTANLGLPLKSSRSAGTRISLLGTSDTCAIGAGTDVTAWITGNNIRLYGNTSVIGSLNVSDSSGSLGTLVAGTLDTQAITISKSLQLPTSSSVITSTAEGILYVLNTGGSNVLKVFLNGDWRTVNVT